MKIDDEVMISRLLGARHIMRRQGGVRGDHYIIRR
jgi:hypothetical protein